MVRASAPYSRRRFRRRAHPLFKNGAEAERVVGATSKENISRMIDRALVHKRLLRNPARAEAVSPNRMSVSDTNGVWRGPGGGGDQQHGTAHARIEADDIVQLARTVGLDRYTRDMTIKRLDHVSVVVDDLAAAIAFFTARGMTLEDEMPVEGPWVDRVNGLERVQVDIVMMRTPDGHGRLELTKFRNPKLVEF